LNPVISLAYFSVRYLAPSDNRFCDGQLATHPIRGFVVKSEKTMAQATPACVDGERYSQSEIHRLQFKKRIRHPQVYSPRL
jgi:hypothetical protein